MIAIHKLLPVALFAITACAAEDLAPAEELASSEAALSSSIKVLGSLEYGQTSAFAKYTSTPKFRAYKFAADAGDKIVVDVRTNDGGDAVAWILNDKEEVVAYNDDASDAVRDAHIELTVPKLPTYADGTERHTHYVVYRNYNIGQKRSFSVELQGAKGFLACKVDSDCEKVRAGCCGLSWTAVNKDGKQAYKDSLSCEGIMCPMVMPKETDDVAQCNNATGSCELVDPLAISCGGFRMNMHFCPEGYDCVGLGLMHDAPGQCRQACGGFGGLKCDEGFTCIDNPMDECDPTAGGADCIGICEPSLCGGFGGLQCAGELECIENPHDECDVNQGGADCGGLCAKH